MASRLRIPLDKGEGAVRPIGVGEILRRIVGKCVMNVVKKDFIEASGSLQLWLVRSQEVKLQSIQCILYFKLMVQTRYFFSIDASNAMI